MVGLDHKGAVNVHLVRLGIHGGAQQYYELFVFYLLRKHLRACFFGGLGEPLAQNFTT